MFSTDLADIFLHLELAWQEPIRELLIPSQLMRQDNLKIVPPNIPQFLYIFDMRLCSLDVRMYGLFISHLVLEDCNTALSCQELREMARIAGKVHEFIWTDANKAVHMTGEMTSRINDIETPVPKIVDRVLEWSERFPFARGVRRKLMDPRFVVGKKLICEPIVEWILDPLGALN